MIAPDLKPLARPIGDIHRDPKNARTRNDRALKVIVDSLRRFGQQKPIVVTPSGKILAGNGTHQAAETLGWSEIAASVFTVEDENATFDDLARAYALVDNKSAERADWDYEILTADLKHLDAADFDLASIGFDPEDTAPLFADQFNPDEWGDDAPPAPRKSITLSAEQYEVVKSAIDRLREVADDNSMGEGRAVELICAEYLSGA
jgi:hypothetical protein